MILGITNYLNENIENVNAQIEKILEKVDEEDLHIFIFHDNNYEQTYHKYENFKNLTLLTENQNKGTLYGRTEIIKNIPSIFDNEFLIWLDADDHIENVDVLLSVIEKYKKYDYVTYDLKVKCVWLKLVKVGAYKKAVQKFKQYPNLRMRTAECNILTAALLDLCKKKEISYTFFEISEFEFITYMGHHQTFNIKVDLYDNSKIDNLRCDLEEYIQWIIWRDIDKLDIDLSVNSCDHVYEENLPRIKELSEIENNEQIIDKINFLINDIIKDMPENYKKIIKANLKI